MVKRKKKISLRSKVQLTSSKTTLEILQLKGKIMDLEVRVKDLEEELFED